MSGWIILAPLPVALFLAYWPAIAPRLWRLRTVDDPIRALVIVRPDGRDHFITRLPEGRR